MSNLSRLSDRNISDPILRAHYYQRVLEYVRQPDSQTKTYQIKLDEEFRPDLVAYRALGDVELDWLVCLVCEIDDSAYPLPVGEDIRLPMPTWIRSSMRVFMDEFGL